MKTRFQEGLNLQNFQEASKRTKKEMLNGRRKPNLGEIAIGTGKYSWKKGHDLHSTGNGFQIDIRGNTKW